MKNLLLILINIFFIFSAYSQTEILIVGTAHEVPEGLEMNYTPILKLTKEWKPDIICSEFRKPDDHLSLVNIYGKNYVEKMDSTTKAWNMDTQNIEKEIKDLLTELDKKEDLNKRMHLHNLFYLNMDRGNANYQAFLIKPLFEKLTEQEKNNFKTKFSMFDKLERSWKHRTRDEYGLAAFPLAKTLNINYLHPTDDQSLSVPYHEAWEECEKELEGTKQLEAFKELFVEVGKISEPAMKNGDAVLVYNTYQAQEMLYEIEFSFFEPGLNQQKDLMSFYWYQRNINMAKHIMEVAAKNPNKKIVVFYGASHIPAIRRVLKGESEHTILTLPDLKSWEKYSENLNRKYIVK